MLYYLDRIIKLRSWLQRDKALRVRKSLAAEKTCSERSLYTYQCLPRQDLTKLSSLSITVLLQLAIIHQPNLLIKAISYNRAGVSTKQAEPRPYWGRSRRIACPWPPLVSEKLPESSNRSWCHFVESFANLLTTTIGSSQGRKAGWWCAGRSEMMKHCRCYWLIFKHRCRIFVSYVRCGEKDPIISSPALMYCTRLPQTDHIVLFRNIA